ncbi:MAG: type II toxin-antitoxin system RelE/ParE family toxin [Wenzhouxiangellaceae bacterium]
MRVAYSPRAVAQLEALYRYIADDAGPRRAENFVGSIVAYCDGLENFPLRGTKRDDIRPGLRITGFRRRITMAFTVDDEVVTILGVFYGGQDYDAVLQIVPDE